MDGWMRFWKYFFGLQGGSTKTIALAKDEQAFDRNEVPDLLLFCYCCYCYCFYCYYYLLLLLFVSVVIVVIIVVIIYYPNCNILRWVFV